MRAIAYNTTEHAPGRLRVRGKWCAFRDGSAWRPIRAEFVDEGGAFVFRHGPFAFEAPKLATGTATLSITNEWDIFGKSRISSPVMPFEITPQNVRPVDGRIDEHNPSQVWYDDAWGSGLSLRYTVWHGRAPRSTREAVIDPQRCPQGRDLQASWLVRTPRAVTLIGGKRPVNPDGSPWTGAAGDSAAIPVGGAAVHYVDSNGIDPRRGAGFKAPQIWYWRDIDPATGKGTLVSEPAKVTALIVSPDTIRLTKTIPARLIAAARAEGSRLITDDVQTIYPDPSPEVTSVDGHLWRSGDLSSRDLAAQFLNDATSYLGIGVNATPQLYRAIVGFDLSATSGTVTAGTMAINTYSIGTTGVMRLTGAVLASATALTGTDYLNTYNTHDTSFASVNVSATGWQQFSLNAAGLAYLQAGLGSTIALCGRADGDRQSGVGDAPHANSYSAEATGTANDPYLEITTEAAAAAVARQSLAPRLTNVLF